jgi:hypothetical protein
VARGLDEEDHSMDAVVHDVHAVHLLLLVQVSVKPLLNVLNNGLPRFVVVDEVAKTRSVNNGQPQTHTIFLDVGADGLDRDRLGDVEARGLALLGRVQRRIEKRIHKRRLAQPRLACIC